MGVKAQPRAGEDMTATQKMALTQKKESPEETMARYEAAFRRIKATTGIENTSEMVAKFIEGEDQIFSLFTFVNELNADIEGAQEANAEMSKSIVGFEEESKSVDKLRQTTLQSLEARLKTIEEQTAVFEEKHAEVSAQMQGLKNGVKDIFGDIGCDKTGLMDQLGNSEVTDSNVMQFLGAVEQRSNELLQLKALLDHREMEEWEAKELQLREENEADPDTHFDPAATLGPKPSVGGFLGTGPMPVTAKLAVVPPSTSEELDVEEEGEAAGDGAAGDGLGLAGVGGGGGGGAAGDIALRPLSHAEMKHRIVMDMNRRSKKD
eukprot:UC1_evm1s446